MTPFQEAVLAIDILVDAMHATAKAAPEAEFAAAEAFAQVRHLGFDTRHTAQRRIRHGRRSRPRVGCSRDRADPVRCSQHDGLPGERQARPGHCPYRALQRPRTARLQRNGHGKVWDRWETVTKHEEHAEENA